MACCQKQRRRFLNQVQQKKIIEETEKDIQGIPEEKLTGRALAIKKRKDRIEARKARIKAREKRIELRNKKINASRKNDIKV